MSKSIQVLVFDVLPDMEVTLDCPENRATPDVFIRKVYFHIRGRDRVVIRTYTDHVVNWIGGWIESGLLQPFEVEIIRPDGKVATYDEDGCLVNWQYGIFNTSKDFPR